MKLSRNCDRKYIIENRVNFLVRIHSCFYHFTDRFLYKNCLEILTESIIENCVYFLFDFKPVFYYFTDSFLLFYGQFFIISWTVFCYFMDSFFHTQSRDIINIYRWLLEWSVVQAFHPKFLMYQLFEINDELDLLVIGRCCCCCCCCLWW